MSCDDYILEVMRIVGFVWLNSCRMDLLVGETVGESL